MDAIDLEKFNDAVSLAQAGKKDEAHQRLKALYLKYKQDVNLLLWLAYTSPGPVEAKQFIDLAIKLDSSNPFVNSGKEWFEKTFRGQRDFSGSNNQVPNSASAPPFNSPPVYSYVPTYSQQPVKSSKNNLRFWLILVTSIFIVVALVGSIVDGSFQNMISSVYPTSYSNPQTMRDKARIGETARFVGTLYYSQELNFNDTGDKWDLWSENMYLVSGVAVKFPSSGNLRPPSSFATFTVKVIDKDNRYLYTEIIDVN